MEELLKNNYTAHYNLPVSSIENITIEKDEPYFEIEDSNSCELLVDTLRGSGSARFSNSDRILVKIIHYDKFVTSLPQHFQENRERCDLIICSQSDRYFILGELKNRQPKHKVRSIAKKQLIESLQTLMAVQEILNSINSKTVKRCCYFNKQSLAPPLLNATRAFNRLPAIFPDGFKMSNTEIELFNFEFFEYTGEQTLVLTA